MSNDDRDPSLPGEELVEQGLADLAQDRLTDCSLLVLIAAPRLRRLGITILDRPLSQPCEHELYARLDERLGTAAHSYYNSLIRRIVSYARSLERERSRDVLMPGSLEAHNSSPSATLFRCRPKTSLHNDSGSAHHSCMLAKVCSAAVNGIEAYAVEVEVNAGWGDTNVIIVGLPDAAVKESRDRVSTALTNSGFKFPMGRTTINLAPADVKKEGPSFDLPIAVGMLAASEQMETDQLDNFILVGELALTGAVRTVKGVLPIALRARAEGKIGVLVPADNAAEAAVVAGLTVIPIQNLREAASFLEGEVKISPTKVNVTDLFAHKLDDELDFSEVKGQESVKRALEIAAAGGHNVLLIGPPGTGKSMLAKRLATILPPLTLEEALETTKIHSIVGLLAPGQALVTRRPFRTPHHTASDAGLLGGNINPTPGEISLAHHGVLFLDELPEFKRSVLETMRQPLEEGRVTISRAAGTMTFPSQFMLVAAMNPTPDGKMPGESRCSPREIQNYLGRISGPLLDRIDLHVEVPAVKFREISSERTGEASDQIRERVVAARKRQQERFAGKSRITCNARMGSKELKAYCALDEATMELLKMAMTEMNFSARAYDRILKVARTIADLVGSEKIVADHISEAIQFRSLDRQLWT